jgi:hypothetical protein
MSRSNVPAERPRTYRRPTGPPTGPAPVLVIDDERAGAITTLGRLVEAGYATVSEAAGCDAVLHKPGASDAIVREVRRLAGADAVEPQGDAEGDPSARWPAT